MAPPEPSPPGRALDPDGSASAGGGGAGAAGDPGATLAGARPFALLALGLLVVGVASWRPVPVGVWHDDGVYVTIARSLAAGDGLRYAGVVGAPPAVKFPPVYPALLALLTWTVPAPGAFALAATGLNLILTAAAGGGLAWALWRHAGLSVAPALLAGGVAFASADVWRAALVPMSEPLFLFLTAVAVALWAPARDGGRGARVALGLVLAAAVLTRNAGVAVAAGVGVSLVLARSRLAAAWAVGPPAVAFVGWAVWSARHAGAVPRGLGDVLGPYGGWLTGQLVDAPGAFVRGMPVHAAAVAERAAALALPGFQGPALWIAALPLLVAIVWGALALHRRFAVVPWVAAAYGLLLLVWPYADRRLLVPLHPFLVVAAVAGGRAALARARTPWVRVAVGSVAFAWIGGYAAVSAGRVAREWAVAPYRLRAARLATAVDALDKAASPGGVVGAPEFWAALHLHGGWTVIPSARFRVRWDGEADPVWGSPEEQLETWWAADLRYLLMEQGGRIHGAALDRIEAVCPGVVVPLARMPPQILVRLDWGEACATALDLPPRAPRDPPGEG